MINIYITDNNFDLINWHKYMNKYSQRSFKGPLNDTFWNVKELFYNYDKISKNTLKNILLKQLDPIVST